MFRKVLNKLKFHFLKVFKGSIFWYRSVDRFYTFQQNKLRGDFDTIKKRQRVYTPFLQKVPRDIIKKYYFLDCGFGRGEFLEILRENNIKKILGVDINKECIKNSKARKATLIKDDILHFLYLYEGKFSGISAFHLIEHFTFEQLFDFLLMCKEKLSTGGILILETPNVENISVSSTSFYYDYTHVQKVPKLFLETLLHFFNFSKIESIYLHSIRQTYKNQMEQTFFGPQDLGIIAYKTA